MKLLRLIATLSTALLVGCGHKEGDGHDHGKSEGHSHGEESSSGATFKAGKGILLTDETRKSLGVELADVETHELPNQVQFTAHIFDEKHHHLLSQEDHANCDMHGAGFVATNIAAMVKPGQPVELLKNTNAPLRGVVLAVQKALALGESEIVIGVSNATAALMPGEFVPARISVPRAGAVPAIPQSALLRTAEGAFVYVVHGDAYFRTAVRTGAEAGGWTEITDGLLEGDQVVIKPVQTLWLVELRATKGGGHSH